MLLRIKSLPAQEKCFMRILPCVLGAVFWFYSLLLRSEEESIYSFITCSGAYRYVRLAVSRVVAPLGDDKILALKF